MQKHNSGMLYSGDTRQWEISKLFFFLKLSFFNLSVFLECSIMRKPFLCTFYLYKAFFFSLSVHYLLRQILTFNL